MVMLTEIGKEHIVAELIAGSIPMGLSGDAWEKSRAGAAKLGIRVSDALSGDSESFLNHQWQPYGE
jgi:hypothetical protein